MISVIKRPRQADSQSSVLLATAQAVNQSCYFGVFIQLGTLGGDCTVAVFERTFVLSTH